MEWTDDEIRFLKRHYSKQGRTWCAAKLLRTENMIRSMTHRLKLKQDRTSDFFKDWQTRAKNSKVGKKRPEQANVMLKNHADGKMKATEEMKKQMGIRTRAWIKENGHPRGMLGKKHTKEAKIKFSKLSKKRWKEMGEQQKANRNKKMLKSRVLNGNYATNRKHGSWKAAWREIGGHRRYFRSKWEANYARYLEWLKTQNLVLAWQHEPDVFWFEGIKRGCVSYLPDFKITNNDGSFEYHEVKGWMDTRSKTKINRMRIYHPKIKLVVIAQKEYNEIKLKLSGLIPDWE